MFPPYTNLEFLDLWMWKCCNDWSKRDAGDSHPAPFAVAIAATGAE